MILVIIEELTVDDLWVYGSYTMFELSSGLQIMAQFHGSFGPQAMAGIRSQIVPLSHAVSRKFQELNSSFVSSACFVYVHTLTALNSSKLKRSQLDTS